MVDDEATRSLQESSRSHAVAKHAEHARPFAVGDRVEALQYAPDVSVVLLHDWVALLLSIGLLLCQRASHSTVRSAQGC